MIPAAHIGIHDRSQEVGQGTHDRPIAHIPAPEAGMDGAHRVGQDVLHEFLVDLLGAARLMRRFFLEVGGHLVRHRLPDRALADRLQIGQGIVHHAVCQGAHLIPVFRVEGFVRFGGIHQCSFYRRYHPVRKGSLGL